MVDREYCRTWLWGAGVVALAFASVLGACGGAAGTPHVQRPLADLATGGDLLHDQAFIAASIHAWDTHAGWGFGAITPSSQPPPHRGPVTVLFAGHTFLGRVAILAGTDTSGTSRIVVVRDLFMVSNEKNPSERPRIKALSVLYFNEEASESTAEVLVLPRLGEGSGVTVSFGYVPTQVKRFGAVTDAYASSPTFINPPAVSVGGSHNGVVTVSAEICGICQ